MKTHGDMSNRKRRNQKKEIREAERGLRNDRRRRPRNNRKVGSGNPFGNQVTPHVGRGMEMSHPIVKGKGDPDGICAQFCNMVANPFAAGASTSVIADASHFPDTMAASVITLKTGFSWTTKASINNWLGVKTGRTVHTDRACAWHTTDSHTGNNSPAAGTTYAGATVKKENWTKSPWTAAGAAAGSVIFTCITTGVRISNNTAVTTRGAVFLGGPKPTEMGDAGFGAGSTWMASEPWVTVGSLDDQVDIVGLGEQMNEPLERTVADDTDIGSHDDIVICINGTNAQDLWVEITATYYVWGIQVPECSRIVRVPKAYACTLQAFADPRFRKVIFSEDAGQTRQRETKSFVSRAMRFMGEKAAQTVKLLEQYGPLALHALSYI